MSARMTSPVQILHDALRALFTLNTAIAKAGVPAGTLELINLRVSQINGCAYCADLHGRELRRAGETDQRLLTLATWRDAPFFTDAERAALALAEAATRLSDRSDAVPTEVWDDAADHYDEVALAGLILSIGVINLWNRTNVTTRQVAGTGWSAPG